jgi:hypothetical protein
MVVAPLGFPVVAVAEADGTIEEDDVDVDIDEEAGTKYPEQVLQKTCPQIRQ